MNNSIVIYNEEITDSIKKELGEIKSVEFIKSYTRWTGTGYRNYEYVVNNNRQVTVFANNYSSDGFYNSYVIEDLEKIIADKKAYGRRVGTLAKKAGVPWNIAVFAGNLPDCEAVEILKRISMARFAEKSKSTIWELSNCGINRRVSAIKRLIGEEIYEKISCSTQNQTKKLAEYLLNETFEKKFTFDERDTYQRIKDIS